MSRPFVDASQATLFGSGSRPRERKPRERDDHWEALLLTCGMQSSSMTTSARGMANRALKEIREAGATPGEILRRGRAYRDRFSSIPTPMALARQWPGLATSPAQVRRIERLDGDPPVTAERRAEIAKMMRSWMEERRAEGSSSGGRRHEPRKTPPGGQEGLG